MVLSSGDASGINFCRSLMLEKDLYHVIGTDTNAYRLINSSANEKHLLPEPTSRVYWHSVQKIISATRPDVIYAADTNKELSILCERRDELGIRHLLPSRDAISIYENKWITYQYMRKKNIAAPETQLIHTPDDIERAIREFGSVWLRSVEGSGGKGSLPTSDPAMAKAWIGHHGGWGSFTASRILTGPMATWIGLWLNGVLIACQGRRRLHWEYSHLSPSGVTGITGAQTTTSDPEIHQVAMAAVHAIPIAPHGIVSVDFRYDAEGVPNLTEIQASRFFSSVLFLAHAGLNFPALYVKAAYTGEVPFLENRVHPLPDELLWLKAIDCLPHIMTPSDFLSCSKHFGSVTGVYPDGFL